MTYRLVYSSIARPGLGWGEVDDIIRPARRFNEAAGLTGLLLYDGTRFMQILEGERAALIDLMARIQRDVRHHDVAILSQHETGRRFFADWSMACQEVTTIDDGRSFAARLGGLSARLADPQIARVIGAFARAEGAG